MGQKTVPNKGKVVRARQNKTRKTSDPPATMPSPCPMGASKVWNKTRPKRGIEAKSQIGKFNDGGEKKYPSNPHLAPGVPRNEMTTKGYTGPDAKPGITRGGSGDLTAGAGIGEAHTAYD